MPVYGLQDVERQAGSTLDETEAGVVSFTETLNGRPEDISNFFFSLVRRLSVNQLYPGLSLESKQLVRGPGGIHSLNLAWEGTSVVVDEDPSNPQPLPEPVWVLKRSPKEEPIETHPDFSSFGVAANGAKFDEDGLFLGFSGTGAFEDNEFAGIEKFLDGGAVVQKTSVYRSVPTGISTSVIPKIDEPSGAPWALPTGSGRNYMKTDLNITQRGAAFEVVEEWTLSGQRGWNTTIYP
jgi:hypothetical protein